MGQKTTSMVWNYKGEIHIQFTSKQLYLWQLQAPKVYAALYLQLRLEDTEFYLKLYLCFSVAAPPNFLRAAILNLSGGG